MNTKRWRIVLLFWCLFIGVGALFGGVCMLVDPTGGSTSMSGLLPGLQKMPFSDVLFTDLTFSGIALLCVNCVPNLVAAYYLFRKQYKGAVLGTTFGLTLMLWITIQFFLFESNPLSNAYFIFGLLQLIAGHGLMACTRRDEFHFDPAEYPAVNQGGSTLVVYCSRRGYVRKLAYEQAQAAGADLCEVTTGERIHGLLGFLWCGRFAMHRWPMPVNPITADVSKYERVILCAPIWAFTVSAMMRAFAMQAAGQIKQAEYVIVHYSPLCGAQSSVRELDRLLGLTHTRATEVLCNCGRYTRTRALDAQGRAIGGKAANA